jgi:hypothetical protein
MIVLEVERDGVFMDISSQDDFLTYGERESMKDVVLFQKKERNDLLWAPVLFIVIYVLICMAFTAQLGTGYTGPVMPFWHWPAHFFKFFQ